MPQHRDGWVSFASLCEYDCLVASGQGELVSRSNWGYYLMEAVASRRVVENMRFQEWGEGYKSKGVHGVPIPRGVLL